MEQNEFSKELVEKLENAKSMDDVVTAFTEEGLEVTKEQLEGFANTATKDELNETDLEMVAGGAPIGLIGFSFRHGAYIARLVKKLAGR